MDKYEYKLKTEQMLELMEDGAYSRAAELADGIDWKRVRNTTMLMNVSDIYEKSRDYLKSYDVLKIAYHRAEGSRKIIYRLCTLALKTRNVDEAIDYYDEFIQIAPKDPNRYLLKYQILRAQRAPIEQQIEALESFKKAEYIEEWAYELAKLYQEAGKVAECLEECDDLILWFSEGKYVYQAMELKMQYKPLTPSQQEKYDRRYEKAGSQTEEIPDLSMYSKADDISEEQMEKELQAVMETQQEEAGRPEDVSTETALSGGLQAEEPVQPGQEQTGQETARGFRIEGPHPDDAIILEETLATKVREVSVKNKEEDTPAVADTQNGENTEDVDAQANTGAAGNTEEDGNVSGETEPLEPIEVEEPEEEKVPKKKKLGNTMRLDEALRALLHLGKKDDTEELTEETAEDIVEEEEEDLSDLDDAIEDIEAVADLELAHQVSEKKQREKALREIKVDPDLEELIVEPEEEEIKPEETAEPEEEIEQGETVEPEEELEPEETAEPEEELEPEEEIVETPEEDKQITGQMNLEDLLAAWTADDENVPSEESVQDTNVEEQEKEDFLDDEDDEIEEVEIEEVSQGEEEPVQSETVSQSDDTEGVDIEDILQEDAEDILEDELLTADSAEDISEDFDEDISVDDVAETLSEEDISEDDVTEVLSEKKIIEELSEKETAEDSEDEIDTLDTLDTLESLIDEAEKTGVTQAKPEKEGAMNEKRKMGEPILPPDIQRLIDEIEGVVPRADEEPETQKRTSSSDMLARDAEDNMADETEKLRLDDEPEEDGNVHEYAGAYDGEYENEYAGGYADEHEEEYEDEYADGYEDDLPEEVVDDIDSGADGYWDEEEDSDMGYTQEFQKIMNSGALSLAGDDDEEHTESGYDDVADDGEYEESEYEDADGGEYEESEYEDADGGEYEESEYEDADGGEYEESEYEDADVEEYVESEYEDADGEEYVESEYDDGYADEYDDEYNDEYEDEYADEYDDEYDDEYADEYEDEYADEYDDEYADTAYDRYSDYEEDYESEENYEGGYNVRDVEADMEEEFRPNTSYDEYDDREIPDEEEGLDILSKTIPLSRKETAKLIATGKTAPLPLDEISDALSISDTGFLVHNRHELLSEMGKKRVELTDEQKRLFSYFVPVRGMSEQLVDVLEQDKNCTNRRGTSNTGNLLIIGNKGNGKTVLAVDVVKAIQRQREIRQGKVAIVTGESLNKKKISDIFRKLYGGALIIEKAGKMNEKTIAKLNKAMEQDTGELLIVLEDQRKPLDRLLSSNREFRRKFTSRLEVPIFINDELVTFGQTYAQENGYRIDEMGLLALYSRIDTLQREDHSVTVAEVKEVMDEAMEHSKKASARKLVKRVFGKGTDDADRILLTEKDFHI